MYSLTSFTIFVLLTKSPTFRTFVRSLISLCFLVRCFFSNMRVIVLPKSVWEISNVASFALPPYLPDLRLSSVDIIICPVEMWQFFQRRIIARPSLLMAWHPLQLPVVNSRSKMSDSCVVEHNNYSACCCIVRLGVSCNFPCYKSVSLVVSIEFWEQVDKASGITNFSCVKPL